MRRLTIAFTLFSCLSVLAADVPVKVYVDGREITTSVREIDGRLYAPIDDISKALGVAITVTTNAPAALPAATAVLLSTPPPTSVAPAIRGRLTYQFNILQSKPDAGAQAWLVKDTELAALAASAGGRIDEPIPQQAVGWETKLTGFPQAVADTRGEFSFENVPAGAYTLIMKSVRANGLAARDRKGKFRFKKIEVRSGQTLDVSFNFGMAAYTE